MEKKITCGREESLRVINKSISIFEFLIDKSTFLFQKTILGNLLTESNCTFFISLLKSRPVHWYHSESLCFPPVHKPALCVAVSPSWFPPSVCWQVVEIALKVSPILGSHMFQPLLPAVFKGIVDGEVSFAMRPYTLCATFVQIVAGNTSILQVFFFFLLLHSLLYDFDSACNSILTVCVRVYVRVFVYRDIQWLCPPTWGSWAGFCCRTPLSSPLFSLKWRLRATRR